MQDRANGFQGVAARSARAPGWWRDPKIRQIIYQILVVIGVVLFAGYLVANTMANLEARSIRTGFDFLSNEAGFNIGGDSLISYDASESYGRAFLVGVVNTLYVAVLGVVLATILGTIVGVARLSKNWLVARLAGLYVEILRNVPLLLQLFFWYGLITGILPPVRNALALGPGVYLSNSGLRYPVPVEHWVHPWMLLAFVIAVVGCVLYYRWGKRHQARTGQEPPLGLPWLGMLVGLPALVWLLGGAPTAATVPEMKTFNFEGGAAVTPEFMALLTGLTLYTASFIAEIVRSGILAVPGGQTEAASAIGLSRAKILRLVLLPQALRIIVPPTTNQYLNLTKNSSLAVAIGYPDLVSIGNTTLNQTGQALECITIMMALYLSISLSISLFMNWYNKRIALVES